MSTIRFDVKFNIRPSIAGGTDKLPELLYEKEFQMKKIVDLFGIGQNIVPTILGDYVMGGKELRDDKELRRKLIHWIEDLQSKIPTDDSYLTVKLGGSIKTRDETESYHIFYSSIVESDKKLYYIGTLSFGQILCYQIVDYSIGNIIAIEHNIFNRSSTQNLIKLNDKLYKLFGENSDTTRNHIITVSKNKIIQKTHEQMKEQKISSKIYFNQERWNDLTDGTFSKHYNTNVYNINEGLNQPTTHFTGNEYFTFTLSPHQQKNNSSLSLNFRKSIISNIKKKFSNVNTKKLMTVTCKPDLTQGYGWVDIINVEEKK